MQVFLIVALSMMTLAACASPIEKGPEADESVAGISVDGVSLVVAQSAYRHGDTASIRLVNGSARPIGYNTCSAAREYWNGTAWLRIETLRVCDAALYLLAAGQSITFEEQISAEWQPGSYRIVLRVHRSEGNAMLDLATRTFTVSQ